MKIVKIWREFLMSVEFQIRREMWTAEFRVFWVIVRSEESFIVHSVHGIRQMAFSWKYLQIRREIYTELIVLHINENWSVIWKVNLGSFLQIRSDCGVMTILIMLGVLTMGGALRDIASVVTVGMWGSSQIHCYDHVGLEFVWRSGIGSVIASGHSLWYQSCIMKGATQIKKKRRTLKLNFEVV